MTKLFNIINFKKNKESLRFFIIIFLFVGGYLFFFTSTLWMPASADASYLTQLGTENLWGNRTVTISRWDYQENANKMEVELTINNKSYDGNNEYKFSAVDLRGRIIKTDVKVADEDWIIVQLNEVPDKWSDISLRMEINNGENEILKLYTNINKVTRVKKIENLDYIGYKKKRFDTEIAQMKKLIEDKRKEQKKLENENAEILKEIERINKYKIYQTDTEKQDSDAKIADAQGTISSNEQNINELNGDIEEITKRIVLKEKQKADLTVDK